MPPETSALHLPRNPERIRRLFFALLPDKRIKEKLASVQKKMAGRKTPPENFHLTLFFLGNQPDSVLPSLKNFIDQVNFRSFVLSLDKTGYFSKIRLSWIGPTEIPPSLVQLHNTTRRFLVPAYLEDKKEAFRPHITLARKSLPSPVKIANPVVWTVDRLALIESILSKEPGKHPEYRILHQKIANIRTGHPDT